MPLSDDWGAPAFLPARPARISRQEVWKPLAVPSFDAPDENSREAQAEAARRAEQELAKQLEASWQAGREAGLAEARQQQADEEQARGMKAQAHWQALLADLDKGTQALHEELAQQVLNLALAFGRRIACEQIRVDPGALLPVLAESMQHVHQRHRQLELQVNPDDAGVAQHWFASEHPELSLKIVPNPRISRGGCVLQAGSTTVDARLETRIERAFAGMGMQAGPLPSPNARALDNYGRIAATDTMPSTGTAEATTAASSHADAEGAATASPRPADDAAHPGE